MPILFIVLMIVVVLLVIFTIVATVFDEGADYRCHHCGREFHSRMSGGPSGLHHAFGGWNLRCPHCHQRGFCTRLSD